MNIFNIIICALVLVFSTLSASPMDLGKAVPADDGTNELVFPLYHDSGVILWRGFDSNIREFKYSNDDVAWKGKLRHECSFSLEPSYIYHQNGQKAWMGATRKQCSFSLEPSYIYHQNGKIAWRGAMRHECSFSLEPCYLYHQNGEILWRGAMRNECSFSLEPCYIYHENGEIAWRGSFATENSDKTASGLYYDNKQLAWSGRAGDPLYDESGHIIKTKVSAVNMELGDGSWIFLNSKGTWDIYLHLGDGNYLVFSKNRENPRLYISLGSGYSLCFFPYTGELPVLQLGEQQVRIDYSAK